MEVKYTEKKEIVVRVLFRSRNDYQFFWRKYRIQDVFTFVNKGSYGFVYLDKDSKQLAAKLIKQHYERIGTGALMLNELCVSTTGSSSRFELNVEVVASDSLFRKLKTGRVLQSV
jgi:hypothetical protein